MIILSLLHCKTINLPNRFCSVEITSLFDSLLQRLKFITISFKQHADTSWRKIYMHWQLRFLKYSLVFFIEHDPGPGNTAGGHEWGSTGVHELARHGSCESRNTVHEGDTDDGWLWYGVLYRKGKEVRLCCHLLMWCHLAIRLLPQVIMGAGAQVLVYRCSKNWLLSGITGVMVRHHCGQGPRSLHRAVCWQGVFQS